MLAAPCMQVGTGQTTDVSSTESQSSFEGTTISATTIATVTDSISAGKIIID